MTLTPFDGREVTECALRITNAGDGLSESLDAGPVELHQGDVVFLVLRGTVAKIGFEPVKDTDELRRLHTVKATFGTIVDEGAVRKILDATRKAIEDAKGVQRIPGVDDDE